MKKPSFAAAMVSYAVLAFLVGVTLDGSNRYEQILRTIVWLMLAAFAVLTFTHKLRRQREEREEQQNSRDADQA